jgi:hypothetical protein
MPAPPIRLAPPRIVNPLRIALRVSPDRMLTTAPVPSASMIVASGPDSLATVMFFPLKLIASR